MKDMQLCHLVCYLPVQFNTDNTDNWNNTIHPNFLEIVDFSVSCWLCVLYEKAGIFTPEDFESSASVQLKTKLHLCHICAIFMLKMMEKRGILLNIKLL